MIFKIRNIGKIKEADISLNGLTIIGGENNTGKSTVGKLVFSLVKSMINYEKYFEKNLEDIIHTLCNTVYRAYRKELDKEDIEDFFFDEDEDVDEGSILLKIRRKFSPKKFLQDIEEETLERVLESRKKFLHENKLDEYHEAYTLFEHYSQILIHEKDKDISEQIKDVLRHFINIEFRNDIGINEDSRIEVYEGTRVLVAIAWSSSHSKDLNMELKNEIFSDDVTFIETPLQIHDSISKVFRTTRLLSLPRRNFARNDNWGHQQDLSAKMQRHSKSASTANIISNIRETILSEIHTIISGSFEYDDNDELRFQDDNGSGYSVTNLATGIKSFGILERLVYNEIFSDTSILIIDEPEVHLHPKWQLEYAKVIVALVKVGVTILITSHSHVMIEALYRCSESQKIPLPNIYFASKDGKIIEDNALGNIYEHLFTPIHSFQEMQQSSNQS